VAVLGQALELGGEDAGYARFKLAKRCFDRGDEEQAWAHLQALEQADPDSLRGPAGLVAELLEKRGDYEAALRWFDRAVTDEDIAAILADDRETGASIAKAIPLFGRARCRAELGLPADEGDRAAEVAERKRQKLAAGLERLAARGPSPAAGARPVPAAEERPIPRRQEGAAARVPLSAGRSQPDVEKGMLVWQRPEKQEAARRWPQAFPTEPEDYYRTTEAQLRERSETHPAEAISLIPASAGEFADYLAQIGADPASKTAWNGYAGRARQQREAIRWPPRRNQPCWCGSETKYKKCCGRPGHSTGLGSDHHTEGTGHG
jgi:tetratricopeptide (TPR) repeat protein